MMANLVFYLWFIFDVLLLIHVVHEMILLVYAFKKKAEVKPIDKQESLPFVTIQLPLYNEKYVTGRLLEAVARIDYPKALLEVQILDDSTDETSDLIRKFIAQQEAPHFDFQHIQRPDRTGYKAGALDFGLKTAKGTFISIFDADFVPDPQFLMDTLGQFDNPTVGLVQSRWTHLNENNSILTRAQAIMLNAHFSVEHLGRIHAKGFINFNGTAGIWRRSCIDDAGGWQADTLTEDLDLSFRAQMTGWEFVYLFDVKSPAELPVTFDAFRTQQFRWSKGAAECVRKNLRALWTSEAARSAKIIGAFHLLNSSVYLLVVGLLLTSPMVYFYQQADEITVPFSNYLSAVGTIVLVALLIIFYTGDMLSSSNKWKSSWRFLPSVFAYFAMASGISLYMVFGIMEGYIGKTSAFVRTPKFGSSAGLSQRVQHGYNFKKEYSIRMLEVLALCYGIFWISVSFSPLNILTLSYGLIILFGFSLAVFFKNWTLGWKR